MRCDGWCTPTLIYAILAVIGILMNLLREGNSGNKVALAFSQAIFAGFWTGILYWLCYICKPNWSWFILVGPFLIGLALLFLVGLIDVSSLRSTQAVRR